MAVLLLALALQAHPDAAILEAGPAAAIPEAFERLVEADPSIRVRLREGASPRLRDYLDLADHEAAFRRRAPEFAKPRRITYGCKDKPFFAVSRDLAVLVGVPVVSDLEESTDPVSLAETTLRVLDLCDALGKQLRVVADASADAVQWEPGEIHPDAPASRFGDGVLRLQRSERTIVMDFRRPRQDSLAVMLRTAWDPPRAPWTAKGPTVLEVKDPFGASLAGTDPGAGLTTLVETLELKSPTRRSARIAVLRGYRSVQFPVRKSGLNLSEIREGVRASAEGFRVTIDRIDRMRRCLVLTVEAPDAVPHWVRLRVERAGRSLTGTQALTAEGRKAWTFEWGYLVPSGSAPDPGGDEAQLPERVSLQIASEMAERRVPFDFRDVELR
jgi:hypothetical protein